jgi:hypothetical protein
MDLKIVLQLFLLFVFVHLSECLRLKKSKLKCANLSLSDEKELNRTIINCREKLLKQNNQTIPLKVQNQQNSSIETIERNKRLKRRQKSSGKKTLICVIIRIILVINGFKVDLKPFFIAIIVIT